MKNPKQPGNEENMKPQQQTGEEFGSVKKGQLKRTPERADLPRGSETETRASPRRGHATTHPAANQDANTAQKSTNGQSSTAKRYVVARQVAQTAPIDAMM